MSTKTTRLAIILIMIGICSLAMFMPRDNFIAPTGTFGVGKTSYHLIDMHRKETNTSFNAMRELMLHIWYPVPLQKESDYMLYDEDALTNMKEFISSSSASPLWFYNGLRHIHTYSYKDSTIPVAHEEETYPVIILLHGSGTMVQHYTWIAEELTSHGYIVIGINHPYIAAVTRFPDNRLIKSLVREKRNEGKEIAKAWKQEQFDIAVQDIRFVLDNLGALNQNISLPFFHRLDLSHIGICGHSSGGSLAMRICLEDKRIKAAISLDGSVRGNEALTPFKTPFLIITAEKSQKGHEGAHIMQKLNELCHKPGMQMSIMTFKGIGHGTFTDLPLLLNITTFTQLLSHIILNDSNTSSAHAQRAIKKIKTYMIDFFNQNLKGRSNCTIQAEVN